MLFFTIMATDRYNQRGVSADKEDVHNAIKNVDKGLFPSAFCKIVPDYLSGDEDYCLIMHADGAGTKSSLAYMYWKETGDISVWKGIAQDALIMNIDDLLCVGSVDNIMLSSTIGRNKSLISGDVLSEIINGTEELLMEYKKFGINIISTGGETADVGDLVRTIIVDSTVMARMKRTDVVDNANIKPTITSPAFILALSTTSVLFIRAITVESTIIVLTKSPTSAVSPPVEIIFMPNFLYSINSSSVPLIISESTSPLIKDLFLPIVEESIILSTEPTHNKSSIFMIKAS
jgi:hypothetical protein